jgi:hypothetical protein
MCLIYIKRILRFVPLKKILFSIIISILLLYSCEEKSIEVKNTEKDSKLKNLEFSGSDNQKQNFKLKAKNGTINQENRVQLEEIKLYLYRENLVFYSIFSKSGTYLKSENLIKLNNNEAYASSGRIRFKSEYLQFNEKIKEILASNVSINYSKNIINGEKMRTDKDFNKLSLEKVKAKLIY